MLTRSGWLTVLGALACFAAGRTFGIVELYVLATAALALVLLGLASVRVGRGDLAIERRLAPPTLVVGAVGRAEITVANRGRRPTGLLVLLDEVAGTVGARLRLGPLAPERPNGWATGCRPLGAACSRSVPCTPSSPMPSASPGAASPGPAWSAPWCCQRSIRCGASRRAPVGASRWRA